MIYFICVGIMAVVWIWAYRAYFSYYHSTHPTIVWATPWHSSGAEVSDGVLIWDEKLIVTKWSGTVTYTGGERPSKVPRGHVVARVKSGGKVYDVKAPEDGYFVPGTDGLEGEWRYSRMWLGSDALPEAPAVRVIKSGASVAGGGVIGKMIQLPQDLRFIGYVRTTHAMEKMLETGYVAVRMDRDDSPTRTKLRVSQKYGDRIKICVNVPWFPPELAMTRSYGLIVSSGTVEGVSVPESAVTLRDGRTGVFVLHGDKSVFTPIDGRVVEDGRFLVTSGLRLGDAVLEDGDSAVEGRVSLW